MKRTIIFGVLTIVFAALLCVFDPAKANAKMSIPEDAYEYNGHFYYYYKDAVTWEEAKAACESLGGHLVVFMDKDEENAIWEYTKKKNAELWIGLYNTALPDTTFKKMLDFTWKSVTGDKIKYENWADDQPDGRYDVVTQKFDTYATFGDAKTVTDNKVDSDELCWGDRNAEFKTGYVCEWDIYEIVVDYAPKKLKKGKTAVITYTVFDKAGYTKVKKATVTFKSSKKKIATVTKDGKVKAKKKGTCAITLSYKGFSTKVKIKVVN